MHSELAGSASRVIHDLAAVASALAGISGKALSPRLEKVAADCEVGEQHRAIASSLAKAANVAIIVGTEALPNPQLSLLQELCEAITVSAEATLGYLSVSANSAGACLAGALPHRTAAGAAVDAPGENAAEILSASHKVLLTLAANPLLDTPAAASLADNNESIIAISSFENDFTRQQADLVLPLAAVIESSGSYVNVEGLWQSFNGCVHSRGESRQGWKILTALGQVLRPDEFNYADSVAVRNELKTLCSDVELSNLCGIQSKAGGLPQADGKIERVGCSPIYACDDMARQSAPLQKTPLMRLQSAVIMNHQMAADTKLLGSDQVQVTQDKGTAVLPLHIDEGVPAGCVWVPSGVDAVRDLSAAYGKIKLEKVS
jgi:NADH-quinone oxidoreductase subunit G